MRKTGVWLIIIICMLSISACARRDRLFEQFKAYVPSNAEFCTGKGKLYDAPVAYSEHFSSYRPFMDSGRTLILLYDENRNRVGILQRALITNAPWGSWVAPSNYEVFYLRHINHSFRMFEVGDGASSISYNGRKFRVLYEQKPKVWTMNQKADNGKEARLSQLALSFLRFWDDAKKDAQDFFGPCLDQDINYISKSLASTGAQLSCYSTTSPTVPVPPCDAGISGRCDDCEDDDAWDWLQDWTNNQDDCSAWGWDTDPYCEGVGIPSHFDEFAFGGCRKTGVQGYGCASSAGEACLFAMGDADYKCLTNSGSPCCRFSAGQGSEGCSAPMSEAEDLSQFKSRNIGCYVTGFPYKAKGK